MSQDTTPSLRDLVARPVTIPVGGIDLPVQPLSWWAAVDAIDVISPSLATMPDLPEGDAGADMVLWFAWIHAERAAVVKFSSLASGQEAAQIEQLPPAAMVELLFGLFEVNADFFIASLPAAIEKVVARVGGLRNRVQAAQAQALSTFGSTSSSAATASPT